MEEPSRSLPSLFPLAKWTLLGRLQMLVRVIKKLDCGNRANMTTAASMTGDAPFLAATNPAPFGEHTFIPNEPLETTEPIPGNSSNSNIFHSMGNLG
jgi:hypothetical protein